MSPRKPLNTKEITELLSKLKAETPDYPSELMEARKAAFLEHAVNIKIDRTGQGGEGGQQGGSGGSGGSGAMLGSGSASGIVLQALIGIAVVAAMLLAAYAFRDKSGDDSRDTRIVVQEEMAISSPLAPGTVTPVPSAITPVLTVSPIEGTPTGTLLILDDLTLNGPEGVENTLSENSSPGVNPTDRGLHLGQTPGTPAAPGQGNPGHPNKPDKPDKPDKPGKPDKPKK